MYTDRGDSLNFIDLFAGAGGLSEGFIQAGFTPIAHVEMNENASKTLETRAAYHYLKSIGELNEYFEYIRGEISRKELMSHIPAEVTRTVINMEMSDKSIKEIFNKIDDILKDNYTNHVNIIVGGPPCQAYSLVGRAQSSHMNIPMKDDPRNELYKMYTRFLTKYQPDMFVFENVAGIKSARGGEAYKNLRAHLKRVGYEFECNEQNSKYFGVLQNRKRMIIIGWKKGTNFKYPKFEDDNQDAIVWDLLKDLPKVKRGGEENRYACSYENAPEYLKENNLRTKDDVLTHHVVRNNRRQDVEIYRIAIEAWNNNHQRLHYDDLPEELKTHKNRKSFVDRFKVVEGDMTYCHTVLAHLSKDGHYFIHPDIEQCRSISVREAARIQTFPDSYFFEGGRTSQFVQIGNAVPPIMAKKIAIELRKQFTKI